MDLFQIAKLDLRLEIRCPRKLTGQCLTEQVIHRAAEIGSDGRLRVESVPQRTELLVLLQLVIRIKRTGRDGIQSIGGIQMILDTLTQHERVGKTTEKQLSAYESDARAIRVEASVRGNCRPRH